jgi:tetratricopeptide (TPR) repeat protein
MVRGALSINMGRVISPTAPLFAEMSQLLSNATRSYNEGVRLLNAGQRPEGIMVFGEALDQTREVRLMFPMNHSARMLELRIEQQTDMPAFNAAFQHRLNQAVEGTRGRDIEAFATLQDLAEINPQFPGIQNILLQAEIAMGFRPPPPNPADLARSAELAGTAAAHINSRDPIRMGVAEAQLEEALSLNPDNLQAQALLDELSVLLTGTGTFVLSSHAQIQYNAALQEFLRGNHLTANAIVQQLLQDPESQRSTLVQDLRRRINAFL